MSYSSHNERLEDQPLPDDETNLEIFFWVNIFVLTFYTSFATVVLVKTRIRGLDAVSIRSIIAVWLSFLIRATNWIVFKILSFHDEKDRYRYFTTAFLIVDTSGTTIFLLNAYYFCFEVKRVHLRIIAKNY